MELVVAEKPSVARDLARVLGIRAAKGADWLEDERYAITWCIGHLVELDEPASYDAAWKPWRLDRLPMLPDEFRLRPAEHARAQLRTVAKLLKDRRFSGVINACDAGREGELIFRYVYQYARSKLPVRRLWISSLTDDAIRRGFAALRPGRDFDALAGAAYSRSEADWLVGMNATRAVTTVNRARSPGTEALLSIGRVQTPTLGLLVRREREIRAFTPRDYWEVRGDFRTVNGVTFTAQWRHDKRPRLATEPLAAQVVERCRAGSSTTGGPRVIDVRARTVREAPPQLFDLTSLQRTANRRFGFSAARTLEIAQALYERHKLLTYPRTDSRHLSRDVASTLPDLFRALEAIPDYAPFARTLREHPPRPNGRIVDDSKVSDHHAIIPTGAQPRGSLDRDEARIFDLVVRRFLGAFYPDAEIAVTEAWIRVGVGTLPPPDYASPDREHFVDVLPPAPDHYLARGRVRLVAGWQDVAGIDADRKKPGADDRRGDAPRGDAHLGDARRGDARDDDDITGALPPLSVGQSLAGAYSTVARQTTPPPRHTEATLLAAMESAGKHIDDEALRAAMKDVGLGTPATRAAIIETLLRRKYIVRERAHLVPTPTGIGLIGALEAARVASLASAELTGSWEARLARVARGEESRRAFMDDIARFVTETIDALRGGPGPSPAPGSSQNTPPGNPSHTPGNPSPAPGNPSHTPGNPSHTPPVAASASSTRSASHTPAATQGKARKKSRASSRARDVGATPKVSAKGASSAKGSAKGASSAKGTSFAKGSSSAKGASSAKASGPLACPRCTLGTLIAGNRGWGCTRWREGCRFVIWFQTAGKRLTDGQLRTLVTTGKTRKATFIDARGRELSGRLVLEPARDGGVRLEQVT